MPGSDCKKFKITHFETSLHAAHKKKIQWYYDILNIHHFKMIDYPTLCGGIEMIKK